MESQATPAAIAGASTPAEPAPPAQANVRVPLRRRLGQQLDIVRHWLRDSQPLQTLLCALLGAIVGAITVLLHELVFWLHATIFDLPPDMHLSAATAIDRWRVLWVPALGGLALGIVLWLMKIWRPREIVDPIEANAIYGGRMSLFDSLRLLFSALISNASGASIGMEAAYTQTGAGIVSRLGQALNLRREDMRVFVAAGAAAAIAAAFNAPLAGAFYAFELVLSMYTTSALPRVAVAALSGTFVARLMTNGEPLFSLPLSIDVVSTADYAVAALLGVGAAILGIATMQMVTKSEHVFSRLPFPSFMRPAIGGVILTLLALVFPQVLGSGQGALDDQLRTSWPLLMVAGLLVAKLIASAICLAAGFRGGLFSTALFMGCLFGKATGMALAHILPGAIAALDGFMLVGMGAVAASIIGAPITMVLLVLEMTGSFPATTAVFAGVLVSSTITRYAFGYSFSTWRFHVRGLRIRGAYDIGWIGELSVRRLMSTGAIVAYGSMTVQALRQKYPPGNVRRVFVIDDKGLYQGAVDIAALHGPEHDKDEATKTALDLARGKDFFLLPMQNIRVAMTRFAASKQEELPVVDSVEHPYIIGYLGEAYTLRRYAQELESRNLGHSEAAVPIAENPPHA